MAAGEAGDDIDAAFGGSGSEDPRTQRIRGAVHPAESCGGRTYSGSKPRTSP